MDPIILYTRRYCFVGAQAEGPERGLRTLFVPGSASAECLSEAISALQCAGIHTDRIYYGAGNDRRIRMSTLNAIRRQLDPECRQLSRLTVEVDEVTDTVRMLKGSGAIIVSRRESDASEVDFVKSVGEVSTVWRNTRDGRIYVTRHDDPRYREDTRVDDIKKEPAVVLFSGGADSAVVLEMARRDGYAPHALTFDYGQRNLFEVTAAKRYAAAVGDPILVLKVDLNVFGKSSLTDPAIPVPKNPKVGDPNITNTYVPARNTIFLSYALAWAEVIPCWNIYTGLTNPTANWACPDASPEYTEAFEKMANLAVMHTRTRPIRFHHPLMPFGRAEIVKLGREMGVDFSLTSSCHDPAPDGSACRHCEVCITRREGFLENGVEDPAFLAAPGV